MNGKTNENNRIVEEAEKYWLLTHPFSVKKINTAKQKVSEIGSLIEFDPDLDGDDLEGQVAAFNTAFLIALICNGLGPETTRAYGIAYVERIRSYFEKKIFASNAGLPDLVRLEMEKRNTESGLRIGEINKGKLTTDEIIQAVKNAVINGELWVVKKDKPGNYFDWEGNILLKDDYYGKWNNKRCLVPSNFELVRK